MRRHGGAAALWLGLSACSAGESRATEITLVLTSDLAVPAELDALRVRVTGPDGREQSASATLRDGSDLPRRVLLRHTEGELAPLRVTAEGLHAGSTVVSRRAELSFVLHAQRVAELALLARCVGVRCEGGTCTERGCVSVASEPDADAGLDGADAELDAAPADADQPSDGGDADAALGAAGDAGPDAGAVDGPGDGGAGDGGARDGGGPLLPDGGGSLPDGCTPSSACITACAEAPPWRRDDVCQCLADCR